MSDFRLNIIAKSYATHPEIDKQGKKMSHLFKAVLLSSIIIVLNVFCDPYYSQYKQDEFANDHFFKNKKDGVFIDIGAYDGVCISNSYFFEKHLDWKGICIEPIPEIYETLRTNRNCYCVQGCIADYEDIVPFLRIKALAVFSGIVEKYDSKHTAVVAREMEKINDSSEIISVKTFLLNNLLEKHEFYHIDFLSIDTEGGELDILQSIDFDKFDIDVITVENNYYDPEYKKFLESKEYKYITRLGCDEMYKKQY